MLTSGLRVSMFGRSPLSSRKRSQTASLTRRVTKSSDFSGHLIAVVTTRIVRDTAKWFGQSWRTARR